jgi:hypothetical protein
MLDQTTKQEYAASGRALAGLPRGYIYAINYQCKSDGQLEGLKIVN